VTKYREAFQWPPLRALNQRLERRGTTARQREAFTPERLMEIASRTTGLDDFGDPHFVEPLGLLCEDIRANQDIHSLGWWFISELFKRRLITRLKLAELEKIQPEIFSQSVDRPLIIVGLPRTGTTRLMRILAEDPANRPLLNWESFEPVPPPIQGRVRFDRRRLRGIAATSIFSLLIPGFQAIHATGADLPEECVMLLANSFDSWLNVLQFDAPNYQQWFLNTSHGTTYAEHKKQLQVLQWKFKRDRWLLKSPGHMFGPAELLATYPDALIVQTHRHPNKAIPSIASLSAAVRGMMVSRLDDERVGQQILEQMKVGVHRLQAHTPEIPANQYMAIQYEDIVRDPMSVITEIYHHMDLPISTRAESAFQTEIASNPKDSKGRHNYQPEQFGLVPERIDKHFAEYVRANNIPSA